MAAGTLAAGNGKLDRIIGGAFAIGLAGVACLAVFGHRGVAPCAGFMALAVALRREVWSAGFGLLSLRRVLSDPLSIAFLAMIVFSIWILIGAYWSPVPGAGELGLTVFVSVLAGGALSFEALRSPSLHTRRIAVMFVVSVSMASAALLFEGLSGAYLRQVFPPEDASAARWKDFTALGRGVTAMAPLIFPAAVLLRRLTGSWIVAATPALALMIAAGSFTVFSNVASISFGIFAFAAACAAPRLTVSCLAILAIVALLASPFIAAHLPASAVLNGDAAELPTSWAQRLIIWKETAAIALSQCMPLGCGADFARDLSEKGATVLIPGWPITLPVMPLHPHNLFLQVWLELGLPGVISLALAIASATAALLKANADRLTMAAIAAAIAAAFVSVMFEASLWQVWRLAVFALAAFGCAMAYSTNNTAKKESAGLTSPR